MISTCSRLAIAGLMLAGGVSCLPQPPFTGSVPPPGFAKPGFTNPVVSPILTPILAQPTAATAVPSLVTLLIEPSITTTRPIDRTDAGTETMTTITRSDGRTKTVPVPHPMPTIDPAVSPRPNLHLNMTQMWSHKAVIHRSVR